MFCDLYSASESPSLKLLVIYLRTNPSLLSCLTGLLAFKGESNGVWLKMEEDASFSSF
jgi:hypothetical protein